MNQTKYLLGDNMCTFCHSDFFCYFMFMSCTFSLFVDAVKYLFLNMLHCFRLFIFLFTNAIAAKLLLELWSTVMTYETPSV